VKDIVRFVVALSLPPVLASCGAPGRPAGDALLKAPLVEAVPARSGALPIQEVVPGVLRARNQVAIRPELEGRIVEVLARSGDAVRRGQLLVRLDADEARERLRQAEADVRLAEAAAAAARARSAELEARVSRSRALAEQELISAQELETQEAQLAALRAGADEAAARVELARALVEERRSALEKAVVRSPVAGRLGERNAEVGMRVDPTTVLFLAGDLNDLIVEVHLTEAMLARVEEGMPVVVETRATRGSPVRAELSRISPFLAEQSFTAVGEIDLDNPGRLLRPGMFATVRVLVGESERATLVPVSAVWEDPATGERGVFVVEEAAGLETVGGEAGESDERARTVAFRDVEVLAEGGGAAGVSGVEEGDWVVTVGQNLLSDEGRPPSQVGAQGDRPGAARVRPVSWERVLALQDLQDEDLLEGFLEKQRTLAAAIGAEIPESEDVVDQILAEAKQAEPSGPGGE
jgi:RND family efflux transporter MFP subunit